MTIDIISSGFGRFVPIFNPPFPNYCGGPLQWGRITSAFGRANGLPQDGQLMALIRGGHASATRILNPQSNNRHFYLTERDAAEFCRRFMTLKLIAESYGVHWRTARKQLEPAFPRWRVV
ncbi:MAG: hypothetical protein DI616_17115 [Paracoccus denitrificans]|uniref:Uncharacterized protein n=1 Tax=Paracoccus denitrificans TaxID=266 RepID=A0A533HZA9_PARDE|nr:MAG: hypothetical protein DI616_17115 [Paracoccus denitrificans]